MICKTLIIVNTALAVSQIQHKHEEVLPAARRVSLLLLSVFGHYVRNILDPDEFVTDTGVNISGDKH